MTASSRRPILFLSMNVRMSASVVSAMRSPERAGRRAAMLTGILLLVASTLLTGCSYVVLGDSLGSPNRATYANDVATSLHVQPTDLAVDGETLGVFERQLLQDPAMRDAVAHADFVTLSIGSNDMGGLLFQYLTGNCDRSCAEATLQTFRRSTPGRSASCGR